jgi:myosin heavy subunit
MPNYEEIVQKSQENVKALSTKINELDELYKDIKMLTKQPEIFDQKFQEIVNLSKEYTTALGAATKKYLDGSNTLFTEKLKELSERTELLQTDIDELKKQVERLEKIDLETHFDNLQKTLSEIFKRIDTNLSHIIQNLNESSQSLNIIQTTINDNHQAILQQIDETTKHLGEQDKALIIFRDETKQHLEEQDKELSIKLNALEKLVKKIKKIIIMSSIIISIVLLGLSSVVCFIFLILRG